MTVIPQLGCLPVTTDPGAEYERVAEKYPPMRVSEGVIYIASLIVLALVSFFREIGWFFYAGIVSGAASWELTKWRLRRNARQFAQARR
jgi:hypothetical protein